MNKRVIRRKALRAKPLLLAAALLLGISLVRRRQGGKRR